MSRDLRSILDGWEYEPGKISVRKIIGRDGREKIQTRVDLGLLHFELDGRPDGRRPYGCASMLSFVEERLRAHIRKQGSDAGFVLLPEDCRDLRHEAHLYYQRYLSLFVLEEYAGVERDTRRTLRVLDLCRRYAETEYDRSALEPQRGYVLMMNTRAKVYQALDQGRYERALALLRAGMRKLRRWQSSADWSDEETGTTELEILESLRDEVFERMPPNAVPRLQWELDIAVQREDYERASELRDRLSRVRRGEPAL